MTHVCTLPVSRASAQRLAHVALQNLPAFTTHLFLELSINGTLFPLREESLGSPTRQALRYFA